MILLAGDHPLRVHPDTATLLECAPPSSRAWFWYCADAGGAATLRLHAHEEGPTALRESYLEHVRAFRPARPAWTGTLEFRPEGGVSFHSTLDDVGAMDTLLPPVAEHARSCPPLHRLATL